MGIVVEGRMLTAEAARARFDFVWTIEGCLLPLVGITVAETALRHALEGALGDHGPLYARVSERMAEVDAMQVRLKFAGE